jgi:hypothetical protein
MRPILALLLRSISFNFEILWLKKHKKNPAFELATPTMNFLIKKSNE